MNFRWQRLIIAMAAMAMATEAIRVYEGTNLGRPSGNSSTFSEPLRKAESRLGNVGNPAPGNQLLKFSKELKPTPTLYKVKLTQQGYLQFLRYLTDIPPLREYTFCLWYMSKNLSHSQPLFSYSVHESMRLLSFWFETHDSTIRMSIRDDLVFKVPALIQVDQWHHICQSWNGVHGEWILFMDGTRIASGRLHKYKATYVPGGGEVVVGQEPTDFHKGLDNGIEGEIFGFNLVDEAVKDEVIISKSHFIPGVSSESMPKTYIPPFKSLPPMKKSYQEIKAFIKSLPSEPGKYGIRNGPQGPPGHPIPKRSNKGKPPKHPVRQSRPKTRPHYKPVKAIIYERNDRQLRLDESTLTKKIGQPPTKQRFNGNQTYNENYSIHSYKMPKEKVKNVRNYEIYEIQEEENDDDTKKEGKRKTRQSFNIHTARQTNNLYAKARKMKKSKKPLYHFEVSKGKMRDGIRRSLTVSDEPPKREKVKLKTPIEFIPVYEIIEDDLPLFRRKRDIAQDDLTRTFRPMPKIPDHVINILSQTKPDNLHQNIPDRTEGPPANVTLPSTERLLPVTTESDKLSVRNDIYDAPTPVQIRRNMVVSVKDLERRPGITAGTELVKRSYEECSTDRGSPIKDKDRLVISWAETPVRIYGGAVVTTALNICGHF